VIAPFSPPAPPLTEQAQDLDRLWDLFFVLGGIIGLIVAGLMLFVILRGRRATGLPKQVREHIPLELAYTVVPFLIVVGLFAVTFASVRAVDRVDDADEVDLLVEVSAFQWQWQFTYPQSGVVVTGTPEQRPELALPAGARVRFDLTSVDVIHSFWIPGFRFKRDVFPGQTTSFQVDVGSTTGSWPDTGVCAEFCGLDHATMRFDVSVRSPDDFARWLEDKGDDR
jgi:cytochrome c oxidase subunit 2